MTQECMLNNISCESIPFEQLLGWAQTVDCFFCFSTPPERTLDFPSVYQLLSQRRQAVSTQLSPEKFLKIKKVFQIHVLISKLTQKTPQYFKRFLLVKHSPETWNAHDLYWILSWVRIHYHRFASKGLEAVTADTFIRSLL